MDVIYSERAWFPEIAFHINKYVLICEQNIHRFPINSYAVRKSHHGPVAWLILMNGDAEYHDWMRVHLLDSLGIWYFVPFFSFTSCVTLDWNEATINLRFLKNNQQVKSNPCNII